MNARGLYQDDPRLLLLMPVFAAFEAALKVPAIAAWMFDGFRYVCGMCALVGALWCVCMGV